MMVRQVTHFCLSVVKAIHVFLLNLLDVSDSMEQWNGFNKQMTSGWRYALLFYNAVARVTADAVALAKY